MATRNADFQAQMQEQLAQFQAMLNTLQGEVNDLRTQNNDLNNDIAVLQQENQTLTQSAADAAAAGQAAQQAAQQAINNASVAQATANNAVNAPPGAGGVPPVVFAATPAMVNHEDLINYQSKTGVMVYDEGRKALTTPFDMKSNGTVVYITELQAKSTKMGWSTGTQQITHFNNAAGVLVDVIEQYGQIDRATLLTRCEAFCAATGAQFQQRARQNNTMMGECILATLTPAARVRLLPFRTEYEINDVVCAPLLHKKVMQIATIDSVATTKTLRANLRELASYCASVKGDIEQVHTYFDNNHSQIIARGDSVDDPVDILFGAYAAVPCAEFRSYIKNKHDVYTDGTLVIAYDELILLATNKYNLLKQEGTWGAKSPDEECIVAMQAELTALKGQLALGPNLKKAAGKEGDGKGKDDKKDKKKTRNKKDNSNKKNQKKDEQWKKIPPKDGEPKEKKHGPKDRVFHWCHHHMAWGMHKPADCNVGKERAGGAPDAGRNAVAAQAASATVINPSWSALLANMERNMADE
jgi:hypothetical protein